MAVSTRDIYRDYVGEIELRGFSIPQELEDMYEEYIKEQTKSMAYLDKAVVKMFAAAFLLKYIKDVEGSKALKAICPMFDINRRLLLKAVRDIKVDLAHFKQKRELGIEDDWSTLYSIKNGLFKGII